MLTLLKKETITKGLFIFGRVYQQLLAGTKFLNINKFNDIYSMHKRQYLFLFVLQILQC